ncbi:MAG TPA: response regulator [Syntrophobacteria bacterium]|nr:response regulator [Syntrophobacteria bacterium]
MATKILVADDEPEIQKILSDFLTRERYDVVLAANGNEMLAAAQQENPELIILDLKMPGMTGTETCRELRARENTWHIPVIIATAFRERVLEAFDAGADDFVTKPFHLEELAVRIKSFLRIQHLTDELERAAAYIDELQRNLP